jgi:hypothetical protein
VKCRPGGRLRGRDPLFTVRRLPPRYLGLHGFDPIFPLRDRLGPLGPWTASRVPPRHHRHRPPPHAPVAYGLDGEGSVSDGRPGTDGGAGVTAASRTTSQGIMAPRTNHSS